MANQTWKDKAEELVAREMGVKPKIVARAAKPTDLPDWKKRHNLAVHGGENNPCTCARHNAPVPRFSDLD